MNASTHHRRKLTILTVFIYLKDTSIAATHRLFIIHHDTEQLCCSFSVFLSMINQQKLYMCIRMGHLANHTHKPYIFGLKILSILCMQRHDFAIAVKGTTSERGWVCLSDIPCSKTLRSYSAAGSPNLCRNMKLWVYQQDNICSSQSFVFSYVELATRTKGRSMVKKYPTMARFGTRFGRTWGIFPRSGTNHTHTPYIDELKILYSFAYQGMTSSLQSKVPPQNSCATGLGLSFRYTLFKVSAQLVCCWLS